MVAMQIVVLQQQVKVVLIAPAPIPRQELMVADLMVADLMVADLMVADLMVADLTFNSLNPRFRPSHMANSTEN
jgi:hypothetical protein